MTPILRENLRRVACEQGRRSIRQQDFFFLDARVQLGVYS
jgi:hypothetical protein